MDFLKSAIASSASRLNNPAIASSASLTSPHQPDAKRKFGSELGPSSSSSAAPEQPLKKFKTRGEIEAEKKAAEQKEKEARIAARRAAAAASTYAPPARTDASSSSSSAAASSTSAVATPASSSSTSSSGAATSADIDATHMLSAIEVKKRLRSYSEPITLFGESDLARFQRLKLFELHQHEKLTSSMGRKNILQELLQKDVDEELRKAMEEEMESSKAPHQEEKTSSGNAISDAKASSKDDEDEEDEVDENGLAIRRSTTSNSTSSRKIDYRGVDRRRADFSSTEEYILYFFRRMLSEWESELDARPKEVRASERGKMASAVQKQTRAFIKPLFKLLKTKQCAEDILLACEKIVTACLERRYAAAQESYLTMAIGNAAWPMGVTAVSIHERASRSKIFTGQIAHVLNDETQRKYIQSVKRLMTFAEDHYSPWTKQDESVEK